MIYEFAIDPNALKSWEVIRYILGNCGFHNGRVISRFPKSWKKAIFEYFSQHRPLEISRIQELLATADFKLLKTDRVYDQAKDWMENATLQHVSKPFRAIVTNTTNIQDSFVLNLENLIEDTQLWKVNKGKCILRDAVEMANCAETLLRYSETVLFVDPHFDPTAERYRRSLNHFLLKLSKAKRIEYHVSNKSSKEYFQDECKANLPKRIPRGLEITFFRWKQQQGKETLHPRYILTNLGGISYEHGLDTGGQGETTDVNLLDPEIYQRRWDNYQPNSTPFLLDSKITIKSEQ